MPDVLPPNQLLTRVLPRIGDRDPEPFDPATWTLTVDGLVAEPFTLTRDAFRALPRTERKDTIHCVTRWSRPDTTFGGVALADLLGRAQPHEDARFVRFVAGRGHDTTLPLEIARDDVMIADALDLGTGLAPLPPEHGGPVRSVVYARYFYKSVKWLRRIELLADDRLGFWERTAGYHNGADPWQEQRFVVPDVDRATLRRLLDAGDLSGRDLMGADLRGMDLTEFDVRRTSLRNADLRDASFRGADLRGAHLCNADVRRADLTDARIDGLDLDGADLRGADLSGASGLPSTLIGAQFVGAGGADPTNVDGLDWSSADAHGLPDDQRAFLVKRGVLLSLRD